ALTRIRTLLDRAGLPLAGPEGLPAERYLELMGMDKKADAGRIRYVLLEDIGRAFV
ncbi:MAG: 3-dehydroquinate synthase, partial [Gemmatimonadetes bacterium]|nr:3-dehydroquinate synthase [Gemmatimonadota bacterium]NIV82416.1 3-dehydroquinate synthase [Gemmatimonadota bacterium]NIX39084.1 3-dehydroquinate synthase [Gemmatimonadota bacterium]